MDRIQLADRKGIAVNPGEDYDYPYDWANVGILTTGITTPAVGGRDRATISALVTAGVSSIELVPPNDTWDGDNNSVPSQPNGAISYEIRFRSDGAQDGSYVVDLLGAYGPLATEHYTRKATLTGTQGQQVHTAGTIYFHDSIAESNDAWFDENDRAIPITARANYIGSYIFNVSGLKSIVFIAITIPASATLYIDARRFS